MRALITAVVGFVVLLAAPLGALAGEPSPVWKDGWTINIPGQSNWVSDATPSPFNLQSAPSTPYVPGSVKNPAEVSSGGGNGAKPQWFARKGRFLFGSFASLM